MTQGVWVEPENTTDRLPRPVAPATLTRPSRRIVLPQIDPPNRSRNWMKSLALTEPSPSKSKMGSLRRSIGGRR